MTTLPDGSTHSICVGNGDNLVPDKSICAVSPGKAGSVVLLKFVISIFASVVGITAKFTLYHIGFTIKFCAGAVCGVNDKLLFGDLNSGDVYEEYAD